MTTLLDRPSRPAPGTAGRTGPQPVHSGIVGPALVAALRALGLGLLTVECCAVLAWFAEPRAGTGAGSVLRAGLLILLAASGAAVRVRSHAAGGTYAVPPLALAVVWWWVLAAAVRRVVPRHVARLGAGGTVRAASAALLVVGVSAAWCALLGAALALGARWGDARVSAADAAAALGTSAAVAGLVGALRALVGRPARPPGSGLRRYLRRGRPGSARLVPDLRASWADPLAAAAVAVGVLLTGAALTAGAAVALHAHQVAAVHRAVAPGAGASLGLLGADVGYLPVGWLWTAAALVGPGFSIGPHTSITMGARHLGALPGLPLLAALPGGGRTPAAWALLAVPLLAGVLAGVRCSRRAALLADAARAVAGTAVLAGGAIALLVAGSAGPLGARLGHVGPRAGLVGAVFALEVVLCGGCALAVRHGFPAAAAAVSATVRRVHGQRSGH